MAEFGLVKSFDIDNGELDGLTPQECFVLGYELAEIDHALKGRKKISRRVHTQNLERIAKACRKAKREYGMFFLHDDKSESWLQLEVAAR